MSKLALLGGNPIRQEAIPWTNTMGQEELNAVIDVMKSGTLSAFVANKGEQFLGGPKVRKFEDAFCKRFHSKYAISVNSATTALHTAIAACGIGPGDEVIVSPYTMSASASAILMSGAVPVFADIDPDTYTIDPAKVEKWITPNTKAILTVNIFGLPSNLPSLMKISKKNNLYLIEDNAQAPGATICGKEAGTFGHIGVFSLNYHKVIHSGEGGMLVTDDEKLAYKCRLLRNHGEVIVDEDDDYDTIVLGSNYRMSELHAAIGIEQLKKLDDFLDLRRNIAACLTNKLSKIDGLTGVYVPKGYTHSYYIYPIKYDSKIWGIQRATFAKAMSAEGFPLGEGYVKPIYLMKLYQHKRVYNKTQYPFEFITAPTQKYERGICPVVEDLYNKSLLLADVCRVPFTEADIEDFVEAISKVWKERELLQQYERDFVQ